MILFWFLTGLMAAGAAMLILQRAARAERVGAAEDPALGVYRRQLVEIDELAARGLLGEDEQRAAHAEVGRRLLREADQASAAPAPPPARSRWVVLAAAVLVPVVALAAYLVLGSPGQPDQPFGQRLAGWLANPSKLNLAEAAAVLEYRAAKHPRDPAPLFYLAKAQAGVGDAAAAARTLRKASALAPRDAAIWFGLGEMLTAQAQGDMTPEARDAFEHALAIDPTSLAGLYLGKADIDAGRLQDGLARWRALAAASPPGDPFRVKLEGLIAQTSTAGHLVADAAPPAQPAVGGDQAAFIQSMVDRLAGELKARPDDPAGWARLIRSYGVLGQTDRRQAAIDQARRLFKDRPAALATALADSGTR